jgi:hypothetical protein
MTNKRPGEATSKRTAPKRLLTATIDPARANDHVEVVPRGGLLRKKAGWRWVRWADNGRQVSHSGEDHGDYSYVVGMAKGVNPGIRVVDADGNVL